MAEEIELYNTLAGCLNPQRIRQSQQHLSSMKRSPTFAQSLLTILSKGITDQQLLAMAMSAYSNYLKQRITNPHDPLPLATVSLIRSNLIDMYFSINKSEMAINLYRDVVRSVIAAGYPWQGLDIKDSAKIEANVIFYRQVAKQYQHLLDERNVLDGFCQSYFPLLEGLIQKILQNYSDQTAKLLVDLLKTFQSAIHLDMPPYLRDFTNLSKWMLYIQMILEAPVQAPQMVNLWKCRAICCRIVMHFFQKYCDDTSDGKAFKGWSKTFTTTYALQMLTSCRKLFLFAKTTYVSEDVIANILKVFYYTLKLKATRPLIIEGYQSLLFEYLLPAVDVKQSDMKLLEKDPLEFIRREQDLTSQIVKRSAIDVIEILATLNIGQKSFLITFVEYAALALVDPTVPFQRKNTIIYILGRLSSDVLRNEFLRDGFSKFIMQYFVPFLKHQSPILLSTTCQVLSQYLQKIEPDTDAIKQLAESIYQCLLMPSLVIKFKAILAFTSLLAHDSAVVITKPHFSDVLNIYINILDSLDHQKLLSSLQRMVSRFGDQMTQVGGKLITHLVSMFHRYCVKRQEQNINSDDLSTDDSDRAATAALNAIKEILATGLPQQVYYEISSQILQLLVYVIQNSLGYMDVMLQVFSMLVYKAQKIADYVFPYLLYRKLLEGTTYPTNLPCAFMQLIAFTVQADEQQHEEILCGLKNMMRKMGSQILNAYPLPSHPALLLCLVENKLLRPQQLGQLNTSQVDKCWQATLRAYIYVAYKQIQVPKMKQAIESVPKGVSLYPWIVEVNDPLLFAVIIRKVVGRIDEEQDDDEYDTNTMSQLSKYAAEEQDSLDGDFLQSQQLYSYNYKSPFDPDRDPYLIAEKLVKTQIIQRSVVDESGYGIITQKLTHNQMAKLQKLVSS